jgi:hypothetical protein
MQVGYFDAKPPLQQIGKPAPYRLVRNLFHNSFPLANFGHILATAPVATFRPRLQPFLRQQSAIAGRAVDRPGSPPHGAPRSLPAIRARTPAAPTLTEASGLGRMQDGEAPSVKGLRHNALAEQVLPCRNRGLPVGLGRSSRWPRPPTLARGGGRANNRPGYGHCHAAFLSIPNRQPWLTHLTDRKSNLEPGMVRPFRHSSRRIPTPLWDAWRQTAILPSCRHRETPGWLRFACCNSTSVG